MKFGRLLRSSYGLPNNDNSRFRSVPCCCSSPERRSSAADLIYWPKELRPRTGKVTKNALSRLKVRDLKTELARRNCPATGSKPELVSRLLEVVSREWAALSPPEASATVDGKATSQGQDAIDAQPSESLVDQGNANEYSDLASVPLVNEDENARNPLADNRFGNNNIDPPPVPPKQTQTGKRGINSSVGVQASKSPLKFRKDPSPGNNSRPRGLKKKALGNVSGPKRRQVLSETHSEYHSPAIRGRSWGESATMAGIFPNSSAKALGGLAGKEGMTPEQLLEYMTQNPTSMQLVFLGTSATRPTKDRSMPALAFRNTKDVWLFDAGEDAQRQIVKHPCIRPSKISRLFLTGTSSELTMGLPGLLCALGAAREHGHETANVPLQIYGPVGLAVFVQIFMEVTDTYVEIPVVVHELTFKPVADKERVQQLSRRCKLWRILIPPDKLNANGWHDADLMGFTPLLQQCRKRTGKVRGQLNSRDERAYFRPHDLPSSGDPSSGPLYWADITWTLRINDEYKIVAAPLNYDIPSVVYVVSEADKAGALNASMATELGVEKQRDFGRLKSGQSVTSKTGDIITPDMVMSADRPGRCMVIMGDAKDASSVERLVHEPDVLALPVTHYQNQEMKCNIRGLTAETAGCFAKSIGARHLVFRHLNPEAEEDPGGVEALVEDAKTHFAGTVTAASDLYTHMLEQRV